MDSLRSRLGRRAALRRALPSEDVDIEALRQYWFSLDEEDRLFVLRFEDAGIVQRMHSHMNNLCRSELWCRRNVSGGITRDGSGSDGTPERLRGFVFECPAETDCVGRLQGPTAFVAVPSFVRSDRLFQDIEETLGSPLLSGRPVLQRSDWATAVDDKPSSWTDLQKHALRLVELAIFHAHRDAISAQRAADDAAAAAAAAASLLAEEAPAGTSAKKSKKKAKKTKARAAATLTASGDLVAEEGQLVEEGEEEAPQADDTSPEFDHCNEHSKEPLQDDVQGWRSPWSRWFGNVVRSDSTEWRWVLFQNTSKSLTEKEVEEPVFGSVKAVVRNTFVSLEDDGEAPGIERIRKSCWF